MKFFRLMDSFDKKIVGKFPQFETGYFPVQSEDPKLILNIFYQEINEDEIFVPVPKLRKGAKLTDFMSGSTSRYIVSDKLKRIIQTTKPKGLQFIPQPILINDEEIGGHWLTNNYNFDHSMIDFKKTEISIMKSVWEVEYSIMVNNTPEFMKLLIDIEYPRRVKIFKPSFIDTDSNDFFALRYVYNGFSFFCSEPFRERLESENITGIRYMELDEVL